MRINKRSIYVKAVNIDEAKEPFLRSLTSVLFKQLLISNHFKKTPQIDSKSGDQ